MSRTVIVVDLSGSWKLHAFNVFLFCFSVLFFLPLLFFPLSNHPPLPPPSIVTVVLVIGDFNHTKPAFLQFR